MELNLDGALIEKAVISAIVDSAIGKQIETAIKKALNPHAYQNVLQKAVNEFVEAQIREIMKAPEYVGQIRKFIAEFLTEEILKGVIEKACTKLQRDNY